MITIYSRPLEQTLPVSLIPLWGEYEGVQASVRMMWENKMLRLRYQVREPQLRRMVTEHNGRVWEDSCVEVFLQREGRAEYVNVECSASTSILVGRGEGRANRTLFPLEFINAIEHSVEILENSNKQSRWTLDVRLPLVSLGLVEEGEDIKAVQLKGNFYCCGDKLAKPHFLAASEIGTLKPDFHAPSFFCPIRFA
jgi:hypothetical protein